jgi:hypothetical protein
MLEHQFSTGATRDLNTGMASMTSSGIEVLAMLLISALEKRQPRPDQSFLGTKAECVPKGFPLDFRLVLDCAA